MKLSQVPRNAVITIVLFSSVFVLLFGLGPTRLMSAVQQSFNKWLVLTMILEKVERYYVDEPNTDELLQYAINGMLHSLDPHSVYLPANESQSYQAGFGYWGIGLYYFRMQDSLIVTKIAPNGPADENDVHVGDRIVSVNGKSVAELTDERIQEMISDSYRGKVNIAVQRRREGRVNKEISVSHLLEQTVPTFFMVDSQTGYVRLERFAQSSPQELESALLALQQSGATQMMLDLRGNSGGDLNAGIQIADMFLSSGKLIAFTQGRTPQANKQFFATRKKFAFPLIVLIDDQTASDGEIVAGALQDWDRALLVGLPTFGKALVQAEFPFQDGSTLLLTTARYFTPLGRVMQKQDSDSKQVFRTPSGRSLQSNGCIHPDVLLSSSEIQECQALEILANAQIDVLFLSVEKYLHSIPRQEYPKSVAIFSQNFKVSHHLLVLVQETAKEYGIELSTRQVFGSIRFKKAVKKEVAKQLWGASGAFAYLALSDDQVKQALSLFDQATDLIH